MKKRYMVYFITIIVFFISYYIFISSYGHGYYSKESSFRGSISEFRKIIEKFYDINKKYPKNINELKFNALRHKYWEQPRDTFKKYDYSLINLKNIPLNKNDIYSEKLNNDSIGYKLLEINNNFKYVLYGINKDGSFLNNGLPDKKIFCIDGDFVNQEGEFTNQ